MFDKLTFMLVVALATTATPTSNAQTTTATAAGTEQSRPAPASTSGTPALPTYETSRYVPNLYIPTQCFLAGELTSTACDVIDVGKFVTELSDAFVKPDAMREVSKVLVANRPVVLHFTAGVTGDARVAMVKEMYEREVKFFEQVEQRIQKELVENSTRAAWLRTQAHLDSKAVQALIAQVFAEQQSVTDATQSYLDANTVPGFRFNCLLACQQLVSAAQGINVFDTATSDAITATSDNSTAATSGATPTSSDGRILPPKHGHTGLIVGGVLGGVGAAGAAAAYGLRKQSSSQSCTPPQQCGAFGPGDPPGCFSGQAFLSQLGAYCRCAGFPSGHNLGVFSCP